MQDQQGHRNLFGIILVIAGMAIAITIVNYRLFTLVQGSLRNETELLLLGKISVEQREIGTGTVHLLLAGITLQMAALAYLAISLCRLWVREKT